MRPFERCSLPALALVALLPASERVLDEPASWLELPPSAASATWSRVSADQEPAELPAAWSALRERDPWSAPATWRLWSEIVREESRASASDPARRAALAILAARHRRSDAAWAHFAAIGDAPAWAAAAIPALVPGAAVPAGPGGLPQGLAADALLEPCLPPASIDPETGAVTWTRLTARDVPIGGARIALVVALEPAGLEIDVEHLDGPAVRAFVRMSAPEGFALGSEYVDWMRQETRGEPLEVNVVPGGEPVALWARFEEQRTELPAVPRGALPAQLLEGGLWLVLGEGASADPVLTELAAGARELLAIDVRLVERAPSPEDAWTGTVVRVPRQGRAAWCASIAGALEAFVLGDPLGAGGAPR